MCGIWTFIKLMKHVDVTKLYQDFMNLQSRGPDFTNFQIFKDIAYVGFHRLAIMDINFHANQPYILEDNDRTIVFICNGEIYNFLELNTKYNMDINTNSDCLIIPKLYIKYSNYNENESTDITEFCKLFNKEIKGEFAFILLEFNKTQNLKHVIVGRDQIGIRPLYYHPFSSNSTGLIFSSEIKGMLNFNDIVTEFEPGTILNININNLSGNKYDFKYVYNNLNILEITYNNEIEKYYLAKIRIAVINSVKRRLLADRPIAFLLSGGVDSSLITAISSKILNQPINTYCCGLEGGTDLLYAKKVAEHINSNHTEIYFTPKEGLDSIKNVIYTTETWDTTTVRASVGQYLVCKYISTNTDAKVVMVGEGPDEVCSSYLFNYYAPDGNALHDVAKEYVREIHMYDGRRADRCISHWGLEGRIAFLDPEFIEAYWSIPAEWRHPKYKGIEKWWLRKAFEESNLLPSEILWRKKEAFSDGISGKNKSWFEIINDYIINDCQINDYIKNESNPSIEAYYYKKLFINYFGEKRNSIIPHYWQPKWINSKNKYVDPSARTLEIYNYATENNK
jgi:asparagine synthase (glutamine-hydrolysing)